MSLITISLYLGIVSLFQKWFIFYERVPLSLSPRYYWSAALSSISNVSRSDKSWKQVSLPNRFGGLGFRSAQALSLPCFLFSSYAPSSLVRLLFSSVLDVHASDNFQGGDRDVVLARESWSNHYGVARSDLSGSQRKWDELLCELAFNDLLVDADQLSQFPLWETLVAVVLRVGANTSCVPTCPCKCGVEMNPKGFYGFSCRLNEGRLPRHVEINSIVKRCLGKISLPCILEPTGLDRGDGRRPDGITTFRWKHGKCLVWDSTVVNYFSKFHLIACSIKSGSAAETAEKTKSRTYQGLVGNFLF